MQRDAEDRQSHAIDELNRHENRRDGAGVVSSLSSGLSLLRDLLYARIHFDVESMIGVDSMLVPVSELRAQKATKDEIALFQVVESDSCAREFGYVAPDDDWYFQWLGQLRMGDAFAGDKATTRLAEYRSKTPDDRRLALMNVLLEVLPESRRAPLVLFRLMPLAVHVATALAFGDQDTAAKLRAQQAACLPSITDCHQCHGAVMDNGELCEVCGSPLWRFQWLNET